MHGSLCGHYRGYELISEGITIDEGICPGIFSADALAHFILFVPFLFIRRENQPAKQEPVGQTPYISPPISGH